MADGRSFYHDISFIQAEVLLPLKLQRLSPPDCTPAAEVNPPPRPVFYRGLQNSCSSGEGSDTNCATKGKP